MSSQKVAQRYATALADLTLDATAQATIRNELSTMSQWMKEYPDLYAVFANPAISRWQKEKVLRALIERWKPSRYTQNFLRLLLRNERLHEVANIYAAYLRELDQRQGITTANVTTARPLREDERSELQAQLEKLTGKRVRLQVKTDPAILGGVVAQIGSEVYDGSILTQLENLRKKLSQ
ncbi:MAG: ATP synthase F1 subunit delta [Acidobacteriota bacterium]|nr:ATP synthase F1 subunit delta [Blastocatellia bacterium]MDW8241199.1 ATP synthase F1 subunit delta [Acidobacteriota bacterium]